MQIRGMEVDFKISRLRDAENFEQALKDMERSENGLKDNKDMRLSELMERGIRFLADFFLKATGCDVLHGCEDFEEAKETYLQFLEEVKRQKASVLSWQGSDIK